MHEGIVTRFRNRPSLAAELLVHVTGRPVPDHDLVELSDSSLGDLFSSERRADLVLLLRLRGVPVLTIVVEVQLRPDPDKRFVWPLYRAASVTRWRCPVVLLVVCPKASVAGWADRVAGRMESDQGMFSVGPAEIPRVTDLGTARDSPELAILSILFHGRSPEARELAQVAFVAVTAASSDRVMV